MRLIAERPARVYGETLAATTGIQLCGEPTGAVLKMLERRAGAGPPVTVKAHHLGGFTRTRSS